MVNERRYDEDEVRQIFELATSAAGSTTPALVDREGMTLAELQDVGREVGLSPERVADAATALDARGGALERRMVLGAPVSVGRIVELPRAATDREWQFLLAELRQTFDAKGEVGSQEGIREWSNGNLHAVLEETESGHRLRLSTRKGNAAELNTIGGIFIGMALFFTVALAAAGRPEALFIPVLFGTMGGGALVANRLRLPRWADERERQMDHIASRARDLLAEPPQN